MSTKGLLGLSFKNKTTKTSYNVLFLTIIICTVLLLGRTFIPYTNVMAAILDGTRGNDILSGIKVSITTVGGNKTQLDDFIYGDNGNDTIYGQDGSDHLSGGDGNDIIYGGNGGDYFFDCGPGLDVVKDFNATEGDVHLSNCEMIQDDND